MHSSLIGKRLPGKAIVKTIRGYLGRRLNSVAIISLKAAVAEQGLLGLYQRLCSIVPDITDQYSTLKLNDKYLAIKARALHSFQIDLVKRAIEMAGDEGGSNELRIVDIGDSSGTHLQYIRGLFPKKEIHTVSVNLDASAIERVRQKGLDAICCKAEDIDEYSSRGDILLSFEMLEHLVSPVQFLHELSKGTNCKSFVITVPYVRHSRIGLHQLRNGYKTELNAENIHILELSPDDWQLVFRFSGWRVRYDSVYLQYPKRNPWRIMKPYWKKFDFEGFYGAILSKDSTWSALYRDWR